MSIYKTGEIVYKFIIKIDWGNIYDRAFSKEIDTYYMLNKHSFSFTLKVSSSQTFYEIIILLRYSQRKHIKPSNLSQFHFILLIANMWKNQHHSLVSKQKS
jgi:hypothetical protein